MTQDRTKVDLEWFELRLHVYMQSTYFRLFSLFTGVIAAHILQQMKHGHWLLRGVLAFRKGC